EYLVSLGPASFSGCESSSACAFYGTQCLQIEVLDGEECEMTRFALIVKGSIAGRDDDPPGITADANNLVDWLRSNEGGAWELEEIWPYRSPLLKDIREVYLPTASKADYSLLAFFGHGSADPTDKNEVLLRINKDEELKLGEFRARSPRSLRLIDACRKSVPE